MAWNRHPVVPGIGICSASRGCVPTGGIGDGSAVGSAVGVGVSVGVGVAVVAVGQVAVAWGGGSGAPEIRSHLKAQQSKETLNERAFAGWCLWRGFVVAFQPSPRPALRLFFREARGGLGLALPAAPELTCAHSSPSAAKRGSAVNKLGSPRSRAGRRAEPAPSESWGPPGPGH